MYYEKIELLKKDININTLFNMNDGYVIEEKYNLGVGLINIEPSKKLVKHMEFIKWLDTEYTIDIYEDGLIKCNVQRKTPVGSWCYYVDKTNPHSISEIFSINITDGNKIDDIYLKLIEDIYRPFCERTIENAEEFKRRYGCDYDPLNKQHISWWGEPLYLNPTILLMTSSLNRIDYQHREIALKQTFDALKTIKTLYDINKPKTFTRPKQFVELLDDEPNYICHHKDNKLFGAKAEERKTKSTYKKPIKDNINIEFQDIIVREAWK